MAIYPHEEPPDGGGGGAEQVRLALYGFCLITN
jgi:hypothetical protein